MWPLYVFTKCRKVNKLTRNQHCKVNVNNFTTATSQLAWSRGGAKPHPLAGSLLNCLLRPCETRTFKATKETKWNHALWNFVFALKFSPNNLNIRHLQTCFPFQLCLLQITKFLLHEGRRTFRERSVVLQLSGFAMKYFSFVFYCRYNYSLMN